MTNDPNDPATWTPEYKAFRESLTGAGVKTSTDIYSGLPAGFVPESGRGAKQLTAGGPGQPATYTNYDLTKDSNAILSSIDEVTRNRILNGLWQRGGYSSGKPGNGFSDRDRSAFSDLLLYANTKGMPWQTAFPRFQKEFPVVSGQGVGGPARVTPRQDVVASIDSASAQALGRKFTDQVTSGLVKQIQGREAGGDKTSLSQMSVAAAGKVAPDEAEAYQFAKYAQVFERLLGK